MKTRTDKAPYDADFELGILGGGQLGRMLIAEALDYDVKLAVLDPSPNAPCKDIAHRFVVGDFADPDTVEAFGKDLDVLTVEIEHVSTAGLERLEKRGVKVFPQPRVLSIVQDKGKQKEFYAAHDIPTAPFELIDGKADLPGREGFPLVQKLRRGGYDGRGVAVLQSPDDLDKAFDAPSVVERLIDFDKELSVIVSRHADGQVRTFPCVELEFNPEANLVEYLFAPADVSPEVEERAAAVATQVIEAFDMTGILAVELFLTKTGDILVNEVAPRPHNSGHHTIEANGVSQYGQLLRAVLGWGPGDTAATTPAAMVNLLGEPGHSGPANYEGLEEVLSMEGTYVHLYGKAETRPFRKMGHITVTADTAQAAKEKAVRVKSILKVKSKPPRSEGFNAEQKSSAKREKKQQSW